MELVKNATSNRARPFASTVKITDTSGTMAIRNAVVTTTVTSRSVALRGPSTTREVRYTARAYTTAVATTARRGAPPGQEQPAPDHDGGAAEDRPRRPGRKLAHPLGDGRQRRLEGALLRLPLRLGLGTRAHQLAPENSRRRLTM